MGSRGGTCHPGVPCIPPVPSLAAIAAFKGSTAPGKSAPGKSALQIVSILCSPWFCLCLCLVDRVTLQLVKICLLSHPLPCSLLKSVILWCRYWGVQSPRSVCANPPAGLRMRAHPDGELKVTGKCRHPKAAYSWCSIRGTPLR